MDQFAALDTWDRFGELLDLANLAVARRPGAEPPGEGAVGGLLRAHLADPADPRASCGTIAIVEIPLLDISSTRIRAMLQTGSDPRYLLPSKVLDIIRTEGLYTDAK
jgi:nicotinate-nucleotide adenylyltransferase